MSTEPRNFRELGAVGRLSTEYDYASIMHYRLSVNDDPWFVKDTKIGAFKVLNGYDGIIGGEDLSPHDIDMINTRY